LYVEKLVNSIFEWLIEVYLDAIMRASKEKTRQVVSFYFTNIYNPGGHSGRNNNISNYHGLFDYLDNHID